MLLIPQSVLDACLAGARAAYPNEFIGLLEGEVRPASARPPGSTGASRPPAKGSTPPAEPPDPFDIVVERLTIPPGISVDEDSAHFSPWETPLAIRAVGTFHSHPSGGDRPSGADIHTASKEGGVQLISAYPYRPGSVKAYDPRGRPLPYIVIKR